MPFRSMSLCSALGDYLLRYDEDIARLQGSALIPRGVCYQSPQRFAADYFRDAGNSEDFQSWNVFMLAFSETKANMDAQ